MIFHGTIIESINPRAEYSTRGLRKGDRSEQFFVPRISSTYQDAVFRWDCSRFAVCDDRCL